MRVSKPTKFQTLCADLIALAQQAGPGAKLPTVLQLRDSLQVSVATLNKALNDLEAQHILYRRHGIGIFVSQNLNRRNIALICSPTFFEAAGTSPFWQMLIEGVRNRADALDEDCSLHFSRESPDTDSFLQDSLAEEIRSRMIHGVLAVGLDEQTTDWIIAQQVPLVAFAGPADYIVTLQSEELVRQAVRHLGRNGCRKIALWSPVAPHRPSTVADGPSAAERAFVAELRQLGLPFFPELVREYRDPYENSAGPTPLTHREQGFRGALEVFGGPRGLWPDGIVSTDDLQTHGVLMGLRKRGVGIGTDVHIVSHGNRGSTVLLGWEDELTILEYDLAEIVQAMFDLLETLLSGEKPGPPIRSILPRLREHGSERVS